MSKIEKTPLEKVNKKIKNELLFDKVTLPLKVAADFAPGFSTIKKTMLNHFAKTKEYDFNIFLHSIYITYSKGNPTKKQINEIRKKLNNPENLPYLSQIIESAIFSRSNNCRKILGYLAGSYLANQITYIELIIIYALKEISDNDITVFKKFYQIKEQNETELYKTYNNGIFMVREYSEFDLISFSKLQSVQLIDFDRLAYTIDSTLIQQPLTGKRTAVTHRFAELLKLLNI